MAEEIKLLFMLERIGPENTGEWINLLDYKVIQQYRNEIRFFLNSDMSDVPKVVVFYDYSAASFNMIGITRMKQKYIK